MSPPPTVGVEVGELRGRDQVLGERAQAVLDARVAERLAGEPVPGAALHVRPDALRPRTEQVDHVVEDRAANPAGVLLRVVGPVGGHAVANRVRGALEQPLVRCDRVDRVGPALDRAPLHRRPEDAGAPVRRVLEVQAQQVVVGELRARTHDVRVGACDHEPVVDGARVGVRNGLLHDRAARAAGADRVADVAVVLDQPLLGHDQRLGLGREVAVVARVVQRRRHHGEAAAERVDVAGGVGRRGRQRAAEVVQRSARRSRTTRHSRRRR